MLKAAKVVNNYSKSSTANKSCVHNRYPKLVLAVNSCYKLKRLLTGGFFVKAVDSC